MCGRRRGNEFSFLASDLRHRHDFDPIGLALWLSQTPCGPLYGRHVSPDRELAAAVESWSTARNSSYDGLREDHLPECFFRGRENRKIQYAILTSAAFQAGLKPDLLDEVAWW